MSARPAYRVIFGGCSVQHEAGAQDCIVVSGPGNEARRGGARARSFSLLMTAGLAGKWRRGCVLLEAEIQIRCSVVW